MAILPLKDDTELSHISFQWVTVGTIATCIAVFLWQLSLSGGDGQAVLAFGAIPSVIFGSRTLPPELDIIGPHLPVITSMFLHGGWMHLFGNMLFLWVFGDNIEDSMGHIRYLVFYLLCGVGSTLIHAIFASDSIAPLIGASGAISGVLGAYLVLHPKARLLVLVMHVIPLRLPAALVLIGWIGLQFFNLSSSGAEAGGVAWLAHIGGFFVGMILIVPFRRRGVPLFDGVGRFHQPNVKPIVIDELRHSRSIFPNTYRQADISPPHNR